jgi:hypothetical protein
MADCPSLVMIEYSNAMPPSANGLLVRYEILLFDMIIEGGQGNTRYLRFFNHEIHEKARNFSIGLLL